MRSQTNPRTNLRLNVKTLSLPIFLLGVAFAVPSGFADSKSPDAGKPAAAQPLAPMTKETRVLVIRSLTAELVYARHVLPQGTKGVTIKDKKIVEPSEEEIERLVSTYGPAVKPGDHALISNILIKEKSILFEINGGPRKKTKWYQHVQLSADGAALNPTDEAAKNAHGSMVELFFDTKFVPEMTGDQIRDLLHPIFDFKAQSAAEAYMESVPPQVKEAIKNHEILVGMNREMVDYSKGRPDRKIREQDPATGKYYEEWLYGQPPAEVQFVRFRGDEVVRLEIMRVSGDKVIRTEKEVDLKTVVAEEKEQPKPEAPTGRPTLLRPGEQAQSQQQLPRGSVDNTVPSGDPASLPSPGQAPHLAPETASLGG
jgi:hypothetical protein